MRTSLPRSRRILVVGDRLLPVGRAERDRDVAHVGVGPATVPVELARIEPDQVPGRRAAIAVLVDGQPATVGDDEDLPSLVPVPTGSHAGRKENLLITTPGTSRSSGSDQTAPVSRYTRDRSIREGASERGVERLDDVRTGSLGDFGGC